MVFSSHIFIFYFLPLALALYYLVPERWRLLVLTLVSYVFYSWTNPWFVVVLMWSTVVDFCCGNLIYGHWRLPGSGGPGGWTPAQWQRRTFVAISLISNLGLLMFFKYFMFAQA